MDAPDDASNSTFLLTETIGFVHVTDAPADASIEDTIGAFTVTVTPLILLRMDPCFSGNMQSVLPLTLTLILSIRLASPVIVTVVCAEVDGIYFTLTPAQMSMAFIDLSMSTFLVAAEAIPMHRVRARMVRRVFFMRKSFVVVYRYDVFVREKVTS